MSNIGGAQSIFLHTLMDFFFLFCSGHGPPKGQRGSAADQQLPRIDSWELPNPLQVGHYFAINDLYYDNHDPDMDLDDDWYQGRDRWIQHLKKKISSSFKFVDNIYHSHLCQKLLSFPTNPTRRYNGTLKEICPLPSLHSLLYCRQRTVCKLCLILV